MKKFLFILFCLITTVAFAESTQRLEEFFPKASECVKYDEPFAHFKCYSKKDYLGICFLANEVTSDVRGYSGEISVLICIDPEARLQGVKVLHQAETPGYGDKIQDPLYLKQFKNKSIHDAFIVGQDVDGITSASISAKSLARIIKDASRAAYNQIFLKSANKDRAGVVDIQDFIVLFLVFLSFLYIAKRETHLRSIFLIIVILYLGFYKNLFISIFNFVLLTKKTLPPLKESIPWYFLFIFILIATPIVGRFYCGWLCPYGALQEMAVKIPFKKVKIRFSLNRNLLRIKYGLLIIGIAALFLFKKNYIFQFEPFMYVFKANFLSIFFYTSILFLAISLFIPRFFCRYLCFVGALLGVISKISVVKYKLDCHREKCSLCFHICPVQVIDKEAHIIDNECLRCNCCQICSKLLRK